MQQLLVLRHCWCWEKRNRPHLPTWSYAKVPQGSLSPEENARLLCVYMRPWTLDPLMDTTTNPLLTSLGKCFSIATEEVPAWTAKGRDAESASNATKVRRLLRKTQGADSSALDISYTSYATSWEAYLDGNVVSEHARRLITNLLAATANPRAEVQGDSSDDSAHEEWRNLAEPAQPDMTHVKRLLDGIAAHSADEGLRGMGKHGQAIRLGRQLWARPDLLEEQTRNIRERFFDDGTFPAAQDVQRALEKARSDADERPAPFAGRTLPFCSIFKTQL